MSKLDTIIATLNTLEVGSLDKIGERLVTVREELVRCNLEDLAEKVDACRIALERGKLDEFRRLRETIVSRLGHVRVKLQ
ncbi:MAG: hypothetical protein BMS9Abin37_0914 [Acidobacteriota bacterium]|nr:MAG: hypothetical protein BMS9Abin37_0914 [Acidobacteriota bacterium]